MENGALVTYETHDRDPIDGLYGSLALPAPVDLLVDEFRGAARIVDPARH